MTNWIASIPARLIKEVDCHSLKVLMALSAFADADDDGWVHAYPAKVAEIAGSDRTTVTRAIAKLYDQGVLERRERKTARSGRKSYEYRVIFNSLAKCASPHIEAGAKDAKPHVESAPAALPRNQLSSSTTPCLPSTTSQEDIPQPKSDVEQAFELFQQLATKLRVSIPSKLSAERAKAIGKCLAVDIDGATGLEAWRQALRHVYRQPGYRKGGDHPITLTMFTRPGNFPRYVEAGANLKPAAPALSAREIWLQRVKAWQGDPPIWNMAWGPPPDDWRTDVPPTVFAQLGLVRADPPVHEKVA